MKRPIVLLLPLLVLLAGCASTPDRAEIEERFLIELTDSETMQDGLRDYAGGVAQDMLDGNCGSDAYEVGLSKNGEADLVYAWRVTCLTYFEGDLSDSQIADTKQLILDRSADG